MIKPILQIAIFWAVPILMTLLVFTFGYAAGKKNGAQIVLDDLSKRALPVEIEPLDSKETLPTDKVSQKRGIVKNEVEKVGSEIEGNPFTQSGPGAKGAAPLSFSSQHVEGLYVQVSISPFEEQFKTFAQILMNEDFSVARERIKVEKSFLESILYYGVDVPLFRSLVGPFQSLDEAMEERDRVQAMLGIEQELKIEKYTASDGIERVQNLTYYNNKKSQDLKSTSVSDEEEVSSPSDLSDEEDAAADPSLDDEIIPEVDPEEDEE